MMVCFLDVASAPELQRLGLGCPLGPKLKVSKLLDPAHASTSVEDTLSAATVL